MDVTLFLMILAGALSITVLVWGVVELTWWGWHRKHR